MDGQVLAFDLGGTRLKAGIVTGQEVRSFTTVPVHGSDADAALAALVEVGNDLHVDTRTAVGLAVPGIVHDGRIVSLPGKFDGIVGRDLMSFLHDQFGLPAVVVNDAIAYGAGEARFGAGGGARRVVVVTIGTGVGVTVYEDAIPLGHGAHGGGILGGHIPLTPDTSGSVDTNGRRGTIEARCNADAILFEASNVGLVAETVEEVFAAYAAGEDRARRAIEAYRSWLTQALVVLAHAHAPDVIVLGGGPIHPGDPVVDGLETRVGERLWPGYHVAIRRASLGDHASLIGVAALGTPVGMP